MKTITVIDEDNNLDFTFYDNYGDTILREFEGFEFSQIIPVVDELAQNGASFAASKYGRRRVAWIGDFVGDNLYTKRRQMLSVMRQTGNMKLIKFTTYNDLDLQFYADIVKIVNPYTHKIHSFLIEAVAPDWRFYSQTEKSAEMGSDDILVITNDGNESTYPVFTLTGPGTEFLVQNNTTGEYFNLIYNLPISETVVVDTLARTVIRNGTTNIYSGFNGSFFKLQGGNNEMEFAVVSDGVPTRLNISYRDAYRGI